MTTLEQFAQIAAIGQDRFWGFLELKDILNLSVCAHATAGLLVPKPTLNNLLQRHEKLRSLGPLKLAFPCDLSTGLVRRILHRLTSMSEGVILIDDRKGRIVLDIGSAYHDSEHHLAPTSSFHQGNADEDDEDDEEDNAQIFKQLEITSFDEYDDFNPRHPLPRDRAHRRGDSYFNSDIEMVVGELGAMTSGGMDLAKVAKAALAADEDEDADGYSKNGKAQTLRPLSGIPASVHQSINPADKPPLPPSGAKMSAKDRILSKSRAGNSGGASGVPRPKVKSAAARDDDDEDDN